MRRDVALLHRLAEPLRRNLGAGGDATPHQNHVAQIELCRRITLLGRLAIPFKGMGIGLGHAKTEIVHHRQGILPPGVPGFGRLHIPSHRFGRIDGNAAPLAVGVAERDQGGGIPLIGQNLQCGGIDVVLSDVQRIGFRLDFG